MVNRVLRHVKELLPAAVAGCYAATVAVQVAITLKRPDVLEIVLVMLVLASAAAHYTRRAVSLRFWHEKTGRAEAQLRDLGFVSDSLELPNRNHLLFELRQAMPDARSSGRTFVLLHITLGGIESLPVAPDFTHTLGERLRKLTRRTDLLARLSDTEFCVLLLNCDRDESVRYLTRLPSEVAIKTPGGAAASAPLEVRLVEYDLEGLFATDLLAALPSQPPVLRSEFHVWDRRRSRRHPVPPRWHVANARTFNTFLHQYGRMSLRHGLAMAVAVIAIQEQSERQRRGADERAGQLVRTVAGALRRSLSAAHVVGILEGNRIAVVFAGLGQTQADAALQAVFQQLKRQHRGLSLVAATAELAHSSASSPEQPLNDAMHRLQAERNRQSAQDAAA